MLTLPARENKSGGPKARAILWGALGLALLVAAVVRPASAAEEPVSKEYQIKAAFLYNFTKFVEWPADRFESAEQPIVIGVLGRNQFGDELEKIVQGRKVGGRTLTILHCEKVAEAARTHVVFVSADDEALLKALAAARFPGVLIVSDADTRGAMIEFTTVGDKVRFEIDVIAAERAGLKVSAQLQKLATNVRRRD
jgi:hypothetical protein